MSEQTSYDFWSTVAIIGAAVTGVAARLSHTFLKRREDALKAGTNVPNLSLGEIIAALIAAPALGLIAGAFGRWQGWNVDICMGLAGSAGLVGPAALLILWDQLVEPIVQSVRAKFGSR